MDIFISFVSCDVNLQVPQKKTYFDGEVFEYPSAKCLLTDTIINYST